MTINELDRWRAAQQLINAHGELAEYQAGVRAADFLEGGDRAGFDLWQDIAKKIQHLQQRRAPDIPLN